MISDLIIGKIPKVKHSFSVVIPTYKRPKYLKQTIYSAINQVNYTGDYEIVIVNNDNSVCEENEEIRSIIIGLQNGRVPIRYYENRRNVGQYGNWMMGIKLSTSDWIVLCHDDDVMSTRTIECYQKAIKDNKYKNIGYIRPNFIPGNVNELTQINSQQDAKIKTLKLEKVSYLDFVVTGSHASMAPPTCGTLIYKKAAMEIGGFKEDYFPSGDAEFVFELSEKYRLYRTISHMGVYGIGVNETFSEKMKKKFIDTQCRQLRELSERSWFGRKYIEFFDSSILYQRHKVKTSYRNEKQSYEEVNPSQLDFCVKIKVALYRVQMNFILKAKKVMAMLF